MAGLRTGFIRVRGVIEISGVADLARAFFLISAHSSLLGWSRKSWSGQFSKVGIAVPLCQFTSVKIDILSDENIAHWD